VPAAGDAARLFVENCASTIATAGFTPAVLSRKLGTGLAWALVQRRDDVWDTIRKRATPGI